MTGSIVLSATSTSTPHLAANVDGQGVAVEDQAQQRKAQRLVGSVRRDALRQQGQKEPRDLGVERVGPKTTDEHGFQASSIVQSSFGLFFRLFR